MTTTLTIAAILALLQSAMGCEVWESVAWGLLFGGSLYSALWAWRREA